MHFNAVTLTTIVLYRQGGRTIFNRLGLEVTPKRGQALVFFPASRTGAFDERLEHEGEQPNEEKWISRIWVHEANVPVPFGLPDDYQ
jgi:hypothetical protein